MTNFIKPEYLVSLYLILNDKEEVTLGELGDYAGKLNKELIERKVEAVFLFSNVYVDETLYEYKDYFEYNAIYEDEVDNYCIPCVIKRKVPNEVLSEKFTVYLSNDVLKVVCDLRQKEKYMSSTKEKIEVMKAYTEGKKIEIKSKQDKNDEWGDIRYSNWDWANYEYRIKPEKKEPTYRPYKSQGELLTDFWAKNEKEKIASIFGGLWLKDKENGTEYLVTALNHIGSLDIKLGETWFTYEQAFERLVYLNDTPFGIKE